MQQDPSTSMRSLPFMLITAHRVYFNSCLHHSVQQSINLARQLFPGLTWHHFARGNKYKQRQEKSRKEDRLNTPQLSRRQTELSRNSLSFQHFCTPTSSNPGVLVSNCSMFQTTGVRTILDPG